MQEEPKDSEFLKGLEAMYERVAVGEKTPPSPDPRPPGPGNLEWAYSLLGLSEGTPLEEIKWAYSTLIQEWNPDRFPRNPQKAEEARAKRQEIEAAYRQILSAHGEMTEPKPQPTPLPAEEILPDWEPPKPAFLFLRKLRLPGLLAILILSGGIFLWPMIYQYDAFQWEGKSFPLRINRITGAITYFNGTDWGSLPLPVSSLPRPFGSGAPHTIGLSQGMLSTASVPTSAPEKAPAEPSLPPASSSPSKAEKPGPVQSPPQKESPASRSSKDSGTARREFYVIQIGAMADRIGAQNLIDAAKRKGFEAYLWKSDIGGRQGYRVVLGRFATGQEAMRFMRRTQMKKIYADSFIRKIPATLPLPEGQSKASGIETSKATGDREKKKEVQNPQGENHVPAQRRPKDVR